MALTASFISFTLRTSARVLYLQLCPLKYKFTRKPPLHLIHKAQDLLKFLLLLLFNVYFTICPAGHSVNFSSYLLKYRQKKVFEAFEKVQVVFKLQQSHVEERCRPCKLISGPKVSLCACICVRNRWQVLLAAFIRSV